MRKVILNVSFEKKFSVVPKSPSTATSNNKVFLTHSLSVVDGTALS